jgi:hypothetical protein
MSRALHRRLDKLEKRQPDPGKWHQIMGHSDEELAARDAELKASDAWREGDHIIAIRFVSPKQDMCCPTHDREPSRKDA